MRELSGLAAELLASEEGLFFINSICLFTWLAMSLTIANPDRSSEVVAVALSFALLMCNLRHDKPSGVMALSSSILEPSPLCGQSKSLSF
jgi:hypothetical protein